MSDHYEMKIADLEEENSRLENRLAEIQRYIPKIGENVNYMKQIEAKNKILVEALQRIDCREYDVLYDLIHETFQKCKKLDKEDSYEKNIDHPEFI